ncbi:hypothetical protein [Pseudonocardia xishanensis]|uniref:Integral membrane protein n=1 Tax=Pseudonocardia xishanensis TaxID=630995 RepID=A0ABP8RWZ6_9PSEU
MNGPPPTREAHSRPLRGPGSPARSRADLAIALPTALVGLTAAVPAVMHLVAVTVVAVTQRGGYDARLAELLVIGTTVLVIGLVVLGAVPALLRGERRVLRRAALASGLYGLIGILMVPVDPPFAGAIAIFGGYALVAWRLSTRRR